MENGAMFITKTELFIKTKNRLGGKNAKITAIEMSGDDSIDIDDEFSFWLIERILKKRAEK